ncbi:DNA-directed RNA polymerase subunit alpha [Candidatus Babeliales bacterium]|nr:DNA-directed RNA polymerase subunit alpha [Candidatus Babeliales bacterium]
MRKKAYQPLTLPVLSWGKSSSPKTKGELIAQPLEPGFGITLGNALRRVMLAAVEGAAVTSVIIKGVNNEFSTIKGVIEDILSLVLNIKGIIIKDDSGTPGEMRLKVSGERTVTVADIVADEHLELLNKDHVLAHLATDGELDITFFVGVGRGYLPAQWPSEIPLQPDDRIFVDAMFSPVKRIEFHVEKTRVGQNIDYDKLIMRIDTNGTVSPTEVVHYSTSVLRTQLEHFMHLEEIPFNEISQPSDAESISAEGGDEVGGPTGGVPVDFFLKSIDDLELSVRAHNCLEGAGIKKVIDLVNLSDDDTLKIKNFGRKSLKEVKEVLSGFGLKFGMNVKELDLKKALKEKAEKKGGS